jgi:hypothetical protein
VYVDVVVSLNDWIVTKKNTFTENPCNFYKNRRFRPIQNTSVKKILFSDGRFSIDFSKRKKQENCRVFPGLLGVRLPQSLISSWKYRFLNQSLKSRASRSWPAGGRCSSVVSNKKVDRCLSVVITRVVIESWKTMRQLIVWCYKNRLDRGLRKKIRCMNHMYCLPKGRASRSWPAGGRCSSVVYNKKVDRCLSVVIRRVSQRIMEDRK